MAYLPIGTETNPSIIKPNNYMTTAFGENRVAQNYTLLDLVNKYELDTWELGTSLVGAGTITHVATRSALRLSVTNASGDKTVVKTHTYFKYQPGKGIRTKLSCIHSDAGQTNQVRRWGYFDEANGVFFRLSGTELSIVIRSSATGVLVDTPYTRTSWNYDKMDGTGPSGMTLDVTKGNIYEFSLQWLGVGAVAFFVSGYLVHIQNHANQLTVPYMTTAQLPVMVEIENTGASTAASIDFICAAVVVEGKDTPVQIPFGALNTASRAVTTTESPVLAIRPKNTYAGQTNRMLVLPISAGINVGNQISYYRILLNPTLTGAVWTSAGTFSGVEYDVTSTAFTGGDVVFGGNLPANGSHQNIDLTKYFTILGRKMRVNAFGTASDILLITLRAAGNSTAYANFSWNEVR